MHKISKTKKAEILAILEQPDIKINMFDFKEHVIGKYINYYRVRKLSDRSPIIDMGATYITHKIYKYELILPAKEIYSCFVRQNAMFHTQNAQDMLDIYNALHTRYLIQNSKKL